MATVVQCPQGAVINHRNASLISVQRKNPAKEQHAACQSGCVFYRQKLDLSAVYTPFYMDSQAARLQRTQEYRSEKCLESHGNLVPAPTKETSADIKRRKRKKPCLNENESKILNELSRCLPDLVTRAKEHNILCDVSGDILRGSDNNRKARHAAAVPGCGDSFQDLCEHSNTLVCDRERRLHLNYNADLNFSPSYVINKCVHNDSDSGLYLTLGEHTFLIPPHSRFLTSSLSMFLSHLHSYLKVDGGYDLIIMDPPWTNKSVKRKKSYQSVLETELCALPVEDLTKPGSLVLVWVTNNARIDTYVKETLFPCWNVHHLTDWIWMKVTLTGDAVLDLESRHKKPYERMIIGRVLSVDRSDVVESTPTGERNDCVSICCSLSAESDSTPLIPGPGAGVDESQDFHRAALPKDFILLSVPSTLHSKKPPLTDILKPYLPPNSKCLELFARNLVPGWTSWGNEPLRHQHMDFFEEFCDEEVT